MPGHSWHEVCSLGQCHSHAVAAHPRSRTRSNIKAVAVSTQSKLPMQQEPATMHTAKICQRTIVLKVDAYLPP